MARLREQYIIDKVKQMRMAKVLSKVIAFKLDIPKSKVDRICKRYDIKVGYMGSNEKLELIYEKRAQIKAIQSEIRVLKKELENDKKERLENQKRIQAEKLQARKAKTARCKIREHRRITSREIIKANHDLIVKKYNEGWTRKRIAKLLEVDLSVLENYLHKHNIKKDKTIRVELIENIRELQDNGCNITDIAEKLNITKNQLWYYRKKYDL